MPCVSLADKNGVNNAKAVIIASANALLSQLRNVRLTTSPRRAPAKELDKLKRILNREKTNMSNQHSRDLLKQGTDAWNIWRQGHPTVVPDLHEEDLTGLQLSRANLSN